MLNVCCAPSPVQGTVSKDTALNQGHFCLILSFCVDKKKVPLLLKEKNIKLVNISFIPQNKFVIANGLLVRNEYYLLNDIYMVE